MFGKLQKLDRPSWSERPSGVLAVAVASACISLGLALSASSVSSTADAAHVSPLFVPHSAGNQTCSDLEGAGQTWSQIKVDPPQNGTYTDGVATITISNLVDAKTFDWSSNTGIDAAFVKAGAVGNYLYRYDPPTEATVDTGLTSPGPEATNQISHVSFCYDGENPSPTPTVTVTATNAPITTPSATIVVGGVSSPPVEETPRPVVVNVPVPAPPIEPRPVVLPAAFPPLGDSPMAAQVAWLPVLLLTSSAAVLAGMVLSAVALRGNRRLTRT